MLPTLTEVKLHLRVDHDLDDLVIQAYLDAAVDLVRNFVDRCYFWGEPNPISPGDPIEPVPPSVRAAILMITETLYDNRGAGQGEILKHWSTEWMLLQPYRRLGL